MIATRHAMAFAIALCALPGGLGAQAARYLPTDHWTYEYIGRLRDRGMLTSLHPLVQPYRRIDIARGCRRSRRRCASMSRCGSIPS